MLSPILNVVRRVKESRWTHQNLQGYYNNFPFLSSLGLTLGCFCRISIGYEVVFVVVDRLTKYVHFLLLSHPFTATKVAFVFMKEVFRLHGMLTSIVSDSDAVFIA